MIYLTTETRNQETFCKLVPKRMIEEIMMARIRPAITIFVLFILNVRSRIRNTETGSQSKFHNVKQNRHSHITQSFIICLEDLKNIELQVKHWLGFQRTPLVSKYNQEVQYTNVSRQVWILEIVLINSPYFGHVSWMGNSKLKSKSNRPLPRFLFSSIFSQNRILTT